MTRPTRLQRFARWLAAGVCVFIMLVWAASLMIGFVYVRPGTAWNSYVRIAHGQIGVYSQARPFFPPPTYRWFVRRIAFAPDWAWDINIVDLRSWVIILPFWMILSVTAGITGLLWLRPGRRPPPGHCPTCGYDLTGNMTGTCPECGRESRRRHGTESRQNGTSPPSH